MPAVAVRVPELYVFYENVLHNELTFAFKLNLIRARKIAVGVFRNRKFQRILFGFILKLIVKFRYKIRITENIRRNFGFDYFIVVEKRKLDGSINSVPGKIWRPIPHKMTGGLTEENSGRVKNTHIFFVRLRVINLVRRFHFYRERIFADFEFFLYVKRERNVHTVRFAYFFAV